MELKHPILSLALGATASIMISSYLIFSIDFLWTGASSGSDIEAHVIADSLPLLTLTFSLMLSRIAPSLWENSRSRLLNVSSFLLGYLAMWFGIGALLQLKNGYAIIDVFLTPFVVLISAFVFVPYHVGFSNLALSAIAAFLCTSRMANPSKRFLMGLGLFILIVWPSGLILPS